VTVTTSDDFPAFGASFMIATGAGDGHAWGFGNNAGAGGNDTYIDAGGGPDANTLATRMETRINAVALPGVVVVREANVLTISCDVGIVAFSTGACAVVS